MEYDIQEERRSIGRNKTTRELHNGFYENISEDMCDLPFSVGLAVNRSHEYMHHICFCHPKDPKDKFWRKPSNGNECEDELYDPVGYRTDFAYRSGWIVYDILLRWYKEARVRMMRLTSEWWIPSSWL